ncbi:MAG: peptidylprolyl isomerase [Planctomycetota bacterium JB042]
MRKSWSMGALVPFALLPALVGCADREASSGDGGSAPADGGAANAVAGAEELRSDPATRTMLDFIAKHEGEPDERGRTIDKSKPNWRMLLPRPPRLEFTPGRKYLLHMETNHGPMTFELRPDLAPMHVSNAIYLALVGFYEGNTSHRTGRGFMVQAGAPDGRGGGNLGYALDLEADKRHVYDRPGLLAAARTPDPHSAGSQFFVMFGASPQLNFQYTIYGEFADAQKTESMITLRKLEQSSNPSPSTGPPLKPIVFEKMTVSVE